MTSLSRTAPDQRTFLIGLDGATYTVLDAFMRDGTMPFLRQFIADGVRAELLSVIPPLTPPAWVSLMTGQGPGYHGVFDFFRFEAPNSHYMRNVNANQVSSETIWSMVGRHGRRAITLNFPMMAPPRPIEGYVVAGWVPWRTMRRGCYPTTLFDQIKGLPGFNVREMAMDLKMEAKSVEGLTDDEAEDWVALHIRRESHWMDILEYLVAHDPCELTAVVFDGVDKLQHLFWRFLDPNLVPRDPTPWEARVRKLCVEYFAQIDRFIARVVDLAGPDGHVFIASDHGFGPTVETFYLNSWLEQQGYLRWAENPPVDTSESGQFGVDAMARHATLFDWAHTIAHVITPSSNGLRIRVSTGEGEPGIDPADYESTRARIAAELLAFQDQGRPVVTRVWTREEAFPGPHMREAADLTLQLRDQGFVSMLKSDRLVRPRPVPAGTHRPEGVFMGRGPALARGLSSTPLSILDVTPALLYSLDLPVPSDVQGHVPLAVFDAAHVRAHPVEIGGPTRPPEGFSYNAPARPDEQAEEEAAVMARLQALGYVE